MPVVSKKSKFKEVGASLDVSSISGHRPKPKSTTKAVKHFICRGCHMKRPLTGTLTCERCGLPAEFACEECQKTSSVTEERKLSLCGHDAPEGVPAPSKTTRHWFRGMAPAVAIR